MKLRMFFPVAGTIVESNSVIQAAVLDVSKIERLVDLSLKPEFINRAKKESSRSKTLTKVCLYVITSIMSGRSPYVLDMRAQ